MWAVEVRFHAKELRARGKTTISIRHYLVDSSRAETSYEAENAIFALFMQEPAVNGYHDEIKKVTVRQVGQVVQTNGEV